MDKSMTRRSLLKARALPLGTAATHELATLGSTSAVYGAPGEQRVIMPGSSPLAVARPTMPKANVYFTRDISASGLLKMYAQVSQGITGKVFEGAPNGAIFAYGPGLDSTN